MSDPRAGWYPDSDVPGGERYWDGQQWTDQRRAAQVPPPPPPPPVAPPARKVTFGEWVVRVVVAVFVVAAIGGLLRVFLGSNGSSSSGDGFTSEDLASQIEDGLAEKGFPGATLTCDYFGATEQGDSTICSGTRKNGAPITIRVTFNSDGSFVWETE